MKNIHIIGGGIIGLCSAWYLQEAGYQVVIVDKTDLNEGCSHGNAGMIVPSHFVPLAAPGVIAQGIRWMFDAKSPFYIKPRWSLELMEWLWRFYKSCNIQHVERAKQPLLDYHQLSKGLYREFSELEEFNFCFEERGLLMLSKDKKTHREEIEVAKEGQKLGLEIDILSKNEVNTVEKGLEVDAVGGVLYKGDAHLYPNLFVEQLKKSLEKRGVQFLLGNGVKDFLTNKNEVTHLILENDKQLKIDKLVVATGSWSAKILKKIGVKILLQDGKGYSITLKNPTIRPTIPTILTEAKVAITPMGNDLRIGGTLEISNLSPQINQKRLAGIIESLAKYYPDLKVEMPDIKEVWHGFRPCSPDGLPYMSRSNKFENLTIATGHSMMGMSLGPASGLLVKELVESQATSIDINLFGVERF